MYASITSNICDLYQVAEKLMYMHEECLEGNFNSIKVLRETNVGRRPATYVRQVSTLFIGIRFAVSYHMHNK